MASVLLTLVLLLVRPVAAAPAPRVLVRATTAAVDVTGGASTVSARLLTAGGREIPGLVLARDGAATTIVLTASVEPGARIEVQVPAFTDLNVEASNGGPVTVRDVRGQLEIVNSNAAIALDRVGGSVLASTSNGPIEARLVFVEPGLPTSFLTSNGRLDVTLPADFKGTLRMESDTGPLTTDFALLPVGNEPVEKKVLRGGRVRTIVRGTVASGGPEIDLRTENAPVVVRKGR